MPNLSNSVTSQHEKIKDNIKQAHEYFKDNYILYNRSKRFIGKTTLTEKEISVLNEVGKPAMEFNVCPAYINRLIGEFSKMDPAFNVRAQNKNAVDMATVALVESHMKSEFMGSTKDSLSVKLYKDELEGGWTVAEIYTDYEHEMSMDKCIIINPVFDPTLCFFDPLARMSHKGDGNFCGQLYPKTREEAVELYGSKAVDNMKFYTTAVGEFSWSYKSQHQEIVLIGDYFYKKKKKAKIVKLSTGQTIAEKKYEEIMERWSEVAPLTMQMPIVVNSRMSEITTIEQYRLCGTQILDHTVTDYSYLPLVFFDGNSNIIRDQEGGVASQVCLPYAFHAFDAQRMKNLAGQTIINEIENMVMHKWMMCIEGIPANKQYQQALQNNQIPTVVLFNAFKDNNPDFPLPAPREVARVPMPPEVMQAFQIADGLIQTILGSYDAAIGVNENDISGKAIMQGAMHSNATAMPYTNGFIDGWNRLGEIYLDLLPKCYITPRTIPIIKEDGKRDYVEINGEGQPQLNYDPKALKVTVEAGVNFEVQKQIALTTIEKLMTVSEQFAAFMNQKGLPILLDNIDIRGIDILKVMSEEWTKEQEQMQKQQQQKEANLPSPQELAVMQVQNEANKTQVEAQVQMAKIAQQAKEVDTKAQVELIKISADDAVKSKQSDIDLLEVMAKIEGESVQLALDQEKVDAENTRSAVDMAISVSAHRNELNQSKE